MKVAVVGAGFAGLAVCWHLRQRGNHILVHLFDKKGIGAGASGVANGLLNPYIGPEAKIAWPGQEGMTSTLELLEVATKALGQAVYQQSGIFRPILSETQDLAYQHCASTYSGIDYWDELTTALHYPQIGCFKGIFIKQGCVVNAPLYLQGLWAACKSLGVNFIQGKIGSSQQLSDYDYVILASGYGCKAITETQHLPLDATKGQNLKVKWPAKITPLAYPINGRKYLLMGEDGQYCTIGATYERKQADPTPNLSVAKQELLAEASRIMPAFANMEVLECQAGIRASCPDRHLPIVGAVTDKIWVLTALGSRGLLQHAYTAKILVNALLTRQPSSIPTFLTRWLSS
ncbi:MAG: hypothetical protein K0S74_859 [Chlamydiales bacterium]|jgi:glycine/D-amino acid oxidase-like deaminating enzyme|nr:hypothetical protein [Chlamydiales bacterium]